MLTYGQRRELGDSVKSDETPKRLRGAYSEVRQHGRFWHVDSGQSTLPTAGILAVCNHLLISIPRARRDDRGEEKNPARVCIRRLPVFLSAKVRVGRNSRAEVLAVPEPPPPPAACTPSALHGTDDDDHGRHHSARRVTSGSTGPYSARPPTLFGRSRRQKTSPLRVRKGHRCNCDYNRKEGM